MNLSHKHPVLILGALALSCAVLFLLPIRVPWNVTVPGRIACSHEWMVTVNTDGGIVAALVDHSSGVMRQYSVAQFDRGDAYRFTLQRPVRDGSWVREGDTVGRVASSTLEWELARLKGELADARATVAVTSSGEKQSLVEEAKKAVESARHRAAYFSATLARQKELAEKGLIARQEYELAERQSATAAADIAMAEARLHSVSTGAKPEEQELAHVRVRSLADEIAALERRRNAGLLLSPIAGILAGNISPDTLAVVADTSAYVLLMPILLRDRSMVRENQRVRLTVAETGDVAEAFITAVDGNIRTHDGRQVVVATARVDRTPLPNPNGMYVRCTVECAPVTLWEYARRTLHTLLR